MSGDCTAVQLSATAGNGWPHNAPRYHQFMSISCHIGDCKALCYESDIRKQKNKCSVINSHLTNYSARHGIRSKPQPRSEGALFSVVSVCLCVCQHDTQTFSGSVLIVGQSADIRSNSLLRHCAVVFQFKVG